MALKMGGYRVGFRKSGMHSAGTIMLGIIGLIIWLGVADTIVNTLRGTSIVNTNINGIYYTTWQFMGLIPGQTGGGLIGIVGIVLAVGVLMAAFRISKIK